MRAEETGITMEVWTDLPGVQFYTANHLDGQTACKEGMLYNRHCAYCFETQIFPMPFIGLISQIQSCRREKHGEVIQHFRFSIV